MSKRPATRRSIAAVHVLFAAVLAACETPAPASPAPSGSPSTGVTIASPSPSATVASPSPDGLKVAFVQDLSPEGALERVQPTLQAVELAFARAGSDGSIDVEVITFDTRGEPTTATDVAAEIAADEGYIGAFAAPGLGDQRELAMALGAADVPLLSLSARDGVSEAAPGSWFRFVVPIRSQALALASVASELRASRRGVCLAEAPSDGTVFAGALRRAFRTVEPIPVASATAAVEAGCGTLVWTGDAVGGAELRVRIGEMPDETPAMVGGAALLDPLFLELAGPAAEGTVAVCPCTDVSTSLDLDAQRFIQDFQSEYGSPPVPYAVEAWDAANLLLDALASSNASRVGVTSWLAGVDRFGGLGGPYAFEGGELASPEEAARRYRVEGDRWVEV